MINRDNYEEYFLLYTDNELSVAEKKAVDEFIEENPDLRGELNMLRQTKLKPEQNIFFDDKDILFRGAGADNHPVINHANCMEYFLLYTDNELSDAEKKMVDEFVGRNPGL